jgi:glycosyltransferase involved in cell wall biosynthesis
MMEYLVDVIVPIYNHEKYLVQTLDSIVSQVTDFPFRVLASDDCSTDNTRDIIRAYAAKYPAIVFPFFHEKNVGPLGNGYSLLSRVTSKYVALCDGDDYWTDLHKLQKQVTFLENNPDFSVCFGKVDVINEGTYQQNKHSSDVSEKDVYTIADIIESDMHIAPTATMVFRDELPKPIPDFYLTIFSADTFILLMEADKGKAKYMNETFAVYRNHSGGMTKTEKVKMHADYVKFKMYEKVNELLQYKYDHLFRKKLLEMTKVRMIFEAREMSMWNRLKNVTKNTPDYFKYSDGINVKEIIYYTCILFFPSLLKAKQKK